MKILNSKLPQGSFLYSLLIAVFSILNFIGNIVIAFVRSLLEFLFGIVKIVVDVALSFTFSILELMEGEMRKKSEKKFKFRYRFRNAIARRIRIISLYSFGLHSLLKVQRVDKNLRKLGKNRNCAGLIVLMSGSMPSVTQVIIATLNSEPPEYDKKGNWALGIINACTSNPLIVISSTVITAYLATLGLFTTAEANMSSGLHTAKEIRDKKWIDVKHDILALMAVAQLNSNSNPLMGIEIIQSGHFGVKTIGAHEVHPFKAVNAGPGIMDISDAGAGKSALHDWEVSTDGIHWTAYLTTRHAEMQATGLLLTTKVWFRTRARLEGLPIPEWSIIYVTVN